MSTSLRKCVSLGQGWANGNDASQSITYNPNFSPQPDNVYFLQNTHTPWVKIWAVPSIIWPSSTTPNAAALAALDLEITTAKEYGFKVILTMSSHYFPSWLAGANSFPANYTISSSWASLNAQLLSRYSPFNPSRPTEFSWIDVYEPLNEPEGMARLANQTTDQKFQMVADMLCIVKQQQTNTGIVIGGPAMTDAPGYDGYTATILARMATNQFFQVGNDPYFVWTSHLYNDVQSRGSGAATHGAATVAQLAQAGFKGWPSGSAAAPKLFNTESGTRRGAGLVTDGTADATQSANTSHALSDFGNNTASTGQGVELITQYLTYTDTGFDTGLLQPRSNGIVYRPAYQAWGSAPSADWPLTSPPGWSGWSSRGGSISSAPAVTSWGTGRIDMFVRSGGTIYQNTYVSTGWTGFFSIPVGGIASGDMAATCWGANRVDLVGTAADGSVTHGYWNGSSWNTDSLGGSIQGSPAICSWGNGRLDVFARGSDNACWHRFFIMGSGWSPWVSLGGILTSDPAAVSWGNGRIDLVVRDNYNGLSHMYYDATAGSWSAWEQLGGTLTSSPAISTWGALRLDVFALGQGSQLWHRLFSTSAGWGSWELMGPDAWTLKPGAVSWGVNRIDVFARGTDTATYQKTYAA